MSAILDRFRRIFLLEKIWKNFGKFLEKWKKFGKFEKIK